MKYWAGLLLAVFLVSFKAFSLENFSYQDRAGDHILITYESQKKWVLDHFLIKPGRLQERVESLAFDTLKLRKKYLAKLFSQKTFKKSFSPEKRNYVVTESSEVIWEVKNEWDLNWEEKYVSWLEANFDKNFFVKYNLSTDCADVAYALRWIFARIHHLPAVSTLAGSLVHFSQSSMKKEWESLPTASEWHKDERFLAALNYLFKNAYTGTLLLDTYPIEITKDAFKVGTINLTGGHTMIISKIDYDEKLSAPIWKLSSTIPSQVRELFEEMMSDQYNVEMSSGGFLRMRWPIFSEGKWGLVAKKEMPFYSKEQYSQEFMGEEASFSVAVFKKLGINFDPSKILKQAVLDIKAMLDQRVAIVRDGHDFCLVNDCEEGSENYEVHSTPSRDGRITQKFLATEKLVASLSLFDPTLLTQWKEILEKESYAVGGIIRSLSDHRDYFSYLLISSHPEDSIPERWGLTLADVKSSLQKNITRKLQLRSKLIIGNTCTNNPEACPFKSADWEKFQTYDFDEKLHKFFEGYYYFCSLSPIDCGDKAVPDSLRRLPFMVSDPVASLTERQGQQIDLNKIVFLPHSLSVKVLGHDYYFLDKGLYNAKENAFSFVGKLLYFDEESEDVLALLGKKLTVFNIATGLSFSYEFSQALGDFDKLFKIAENSYVLENCKTLSREYRCDNILISTEGGVVNILKTFIKTPNPSSYESNKLNILKKKAKLIVSEDLHYYLLYEDLLGVVQTYELLEATTDILETSKYIYLAFDEKLEIFSRNDKKIIYSKTFSHPLNLYPTSASETIILSVLKNDNSIYKIIKMTENGLSEILSLEGWLVTRNVYDSATFLEIYPKDQNTAVKYILEENGVRELSQYKNLFFIDGAFPWMSFSQTDLSKISYENILTGENKNLASDNFYLFCQNDSLIKESSCYSAKLDLASKTHLELSPSSYTFYNTYVYVDPSTPFESKMKLLSSKKVLEMTTSSYEAQSSEPAVNYIKEGNLIKFADNIYIHLK